MARMHRLGVAFVASTAALVLPGCSWLFITPPPPHAHRGEGVKCTTSPAAPIADTIFAGANVAGALVVIGTGGSPLPPADNALAATGLVWAIVDTFAAVHGYKVTAACRDLVGDGPENMSEPDDQWLLPDGGKPVRAPDHKREPPPSDSRPVPE